MSVVREKPLLSICVPTYNRAALLSDLLFSIRAQNPPLEQLEIVISDNASTDHTRDVVITHETCLPISYYRNDVNVGGCKNVLLSVSRAEGSFCWVIGDDDLLCTDSIATAFEILNRHPLVAAIVVGYSYESIDNRHKILACLNQHNPWPFSGPVFDLDASSKIVERWENTFRFASIPALHTAIVSAIFRREDWCEYAGDISKAIRDVHHLSLASTFPQSMIWARSLSGREVFFHGQPLVCFFVGAQAWLGKWPAMLFSRVLELSVYFDAVGCDSECVEYYRRLVLSNPTLGNLCLSREPYDVATFSLPWLLRSFGDRACLWENLINWSANNALLSPRRKFLVSMKFIIMGILTVQSIRCRPFAGFCSYTFRSFFAYEYGLLAGRLARLKKDLGLGRP